MSTSMIVLLHRYGCWHQVVIHFLFFVKLKVSFSSNSLRIKSWCNVPSHSHTSSGRQDSLPPSAQWFVGCRWPIGYSLFMFCCCCSSGREPFKRRPILNHLHQIAIRIGDPLTAFTNGKPWISPILARQSQWRVMTSGLNSVMNPTAMNPTVIITDNHGVINAQS